MRLFVLGASGGTGTALVAQGLERGHRVTTFGRSVSRTRCHDGLTAILGSVVSADDLGAVLPNHDAVLSALGTHGLGPTCLLRDSAHAVTQAMLHAGVNRLIVISSNLVAGPSWLDRVLARTILRHHAGDQREMEDVVTKSDLDWTVVRAPTLTNRTLTERYALINDSPGNARSTSIGRRDLARLMLLAVERSSHIKQRVGIVRDRS